MLQSSPAAGHPGQSLRPSSASRSSGRWIRPFGHGRSGSGDSNEVHSANDPFAPDSSSIVTLAFIRLHSCHAESDTPKPISAPDLMEVINGTAKMKGQSSKKFRLGISGSGGGASLVIREDQSKKVLQEVPLLFTSVHYCRESPEGLMLIGLRTTLEDLPSVSSIPRRNAPPAPQLPVTAPAPQTSGPSPRRPSRVVAAATREPAWLMVVEGGEEALQRALIALAAGGALRHDLEQAYNLDDGILGIGGFGTVKLARAKHRQDKDKKEQVVVKYVAADVGFSKQLSPGQVRQVVSQQAASIGDNFSPELPQVLPKVLRSEIEFLTTARGHPHIVGLHAVFQRDDVGWALVMDYCAGGDLFALLAKVSTLPEAACKALMLGLLDALVHIHKLEILHRDVKPENLLLHLGGRPVLADFGLACRADDGQETRRRIGSPGFIAPEVLRGSRCTGKADVFGAGVTFHFALTGTQPFSGKDLASTLRKTVSDNVRYDSDVFAVLSPACTSLAQSLLTKKPEDRPTSLEARASAWLDSKSEPEEPRPPASSRSLPVRIRPVTPQGNSHRRPFGQFVHVKEKSSPPCAKEDIFITGKQAEVSAASTSFPKSRRPVSARCGSRAENHGQGSTVREPTTPRPTKNPLPTSLRRWGADKDREEKITGG
mmetsp:Transcript_97743/g.174130  ORF Transcript_97743/g.174130 Transcript_97743/m.174130 type:complete len:657 (+) Transcript_97743:131-2101(+)|eukprot:CAMPEP_0197629224 /NCGR_PEP_ID=MMETSP1338-20131121/7171_1 /TAXON_ID=43686 ORGANISM="Pelagodinium beii, Strain RCC1491" /NCGR_SAMPLE_ID=MMETSP1338 /ASSEMBLY_ACC=CAM_ASM_000754 /LENGTH=656 /DNA_ID=CAMNT_0043200249 /DNA_START=127 /DNA_END=2097 /DNA_ORIENTATION=-